MFHGLAALSLIGNVKFRFHYMQQGICVLVEVRVEELRVSRE
jgi:hypothetical protein